MKTLTLLALVAISTAGCQHLETRPPECGSKETISLVKQLFSQTTSSQWENSWEMTDTLHLYNIRTIGYDEAAKRYTCAADASVGFTVEPGTVFGSKEALDNAIEQANKNIAKYHEIEANKGKVAIQYGQVIAAAYENSLQQSIGSFGIKLIPRIGSAKIADGKISGTIEFSSTIAQDESGQKKHYVEDMGGMVNLAAAYPVVLSTGLVMFTAQQTR